MPAPPTRSVRERIAILESQDRIKATPFAKPEPPMYRSSVLDKDPTIVAPKPTKTKPPVLPLRPLETPALTTPLSNGNFLSPQITPASFLQGTRGNCVRHGRKQPVPPTGGAAKETLAKGRSGVYQPTGLIQMRQMDATSPWVVPKPESWKEACPDCVAELRIKRRELMTGGSEDVLAALASDKMMQAGHNLVEQKELDNSIDAIIFERKGELKRVVLNSKTTHGNTTAEMMQRLSHELARVSGEIARTPAPAVLNPRNVVTRMVSAQELRPGYFDAHNASVPELLDIIDAAANEIQLNTGKVAERNIRRPSVLDRSKNSFLQESEFDTVVSDEAVSSLGLVSRQSIDEQYRTLHDRLVNAGKSGNPAQSPQPVRPPPSLPSTSIHPEPPRIMMTRPTLSAAVAPKKPTKSPQTPSPDHPTLHHAPTLASKSPSPQPKTPSPTHPYSSALNFLNPFSRRGTPANRPVTPPFRTPSPSSPQSQVPDPTTNPSSTPSQEKVRIRPRDESPESTTPQPISSQANPYHRVPRVARGFDNAVEKKTSGMEDRQQSQQQQRTVHEARKLDGERIAPPTTTTTASKETGPGKSVQEQAWQSSLMEREGRRVRSSGVTAEAGGERDGGKVRKGWFG